MKSTKRSKPKLVAAVIGGGAMATMGALSLGMHQQPTIAHTASVGKLTLAATTTASGKAATVEATSMAVPLIKGPAPLPSEQKAAE